MDRIGPPPKNTENPRIPDTFDDWPLFIPDDLETSLVGWTNEEFSLPPWSPALHEAVSIALQREAHSALQGADVQTQSATVEEQDISILDQGANSQQPEPHVQQREVHDQQHHVDANQANTNVQQPHIDSQTDAKDVDQVDVSAQQPGVDVDQTEANAQRPGARSQLSRTAGELRCPCHPDKVYETKSALVRHLNKEQKKFRCEMPECLHHGRVPCFGSRSDQMRHLREIHGVTDIAGLNQAQRFYCPIESCLRHEKGFPRQANLTHHLATQHPQQGLDEAVDAGASTQAQASPATLGQPLHTDRTMLPPSHASSIAPIHSPESRGFPTTEETDANFLRSKRLVDLAGEKLEKERKRARLEKEIAALEDEIRRAVESHA